MKNSDELLNQARMYRNKNNFEEAIKFYSRYLQNSKNDSVRYELAIYLCMNGFAKEALVHFKQLLVKNPSNVQVQIAYATALLDSADYNNAIKEYKKILNNNNHLIHLNLALGEALRRAKDYDNAIKTFKILLDKKNDSHEAFCALGITYRDIEDYPRALECLENAVGLQPINQFYRLQFANLLYRTELLDLAEIQVQEAISIDNKSYEAKGLHAEILEANNKHKKALDVLNDLIKSFPNQTGTFIKKAELLMQVRMYEESILIYDKLIQENKHKREAIFGKFHVLHRNSKLIEARNLIEDYLHVNQNDMSALIMHMHVANYKSDDKKVIEVIESLTEENRNSSSARFALARVMEVNKKWDQAYYYYSESKKIRSLSIVKKYDPVKLEKLVDQIIIQFNEDTIEKLTTYATKENRPIFFFGMPRSGKTVIASMLECHNDIKNLDEMKFWSDAFETVKIKNRTKYPQVLNFIEIDDARNSVIEYMNLLTSFVGEKYSYIVDTFPYNFIYFGIIASLIPNAKFFHCKRNQFDTCLDIYFKNFKHGHEYSYDLENIAHFYIQYKRLMSFWYQKFPGVINDIEFESVISNPISQFDFVLDKINLNKNNVNYEKLNTESNKIKSYAGSIYKYKNYKNHIQNLLINLAD